MLQFPQFQVFYAKQKMWVNNKMEKCRDGQYIMQHFQIFWDLRYLRCEYEQWRASSDVEMCGRVHCCLHLNFI